MGGPGGAALCSFLQPTKRAAARLVQRTIATKQDNGCLFGVLIEYLLELRIAPSKFSFEHFTRKELASNGHSSRVRR
jgi:hypothetical protein